MRALTVALIAFAGALPAGCGGDSSEEAGLGSVGHVFTIVLDNKDYEVTFG